MNSQLDDLLDGGFIERYHVKGQRMLTRQSVAEHSWRMAAVLFYIDPEASTDLIWATLFHDVSERVTGDMPSNVKRASPEMARTVHNVSEAEEVRLGIRFSLTDTEQRLLAFIDRFEGVLHCLDELEMGNRKVTGTLLRYLEYAGDHKKYELVGYPGYETRRRELYTRAYERAHRLFNHQGA